MEKSEKRKKNKSNRTFKKARFVQDVCSVCGSQHAGICTKPSDDQPEMVQQTQSHETLKATIDAYSARLKGYSGTARDDTKRPFIIEFVHAVFENIPRNETLVEPGMITNIVSVIYAAALWEDYHCTNMLFNDGVITLVNKLTTFPEGLSAILSGLAKAMMSYRNLQYERKINDYDFIHRWLKDSLEASNITSAKECISLILWYVTLDWIRSRSRNAFSECSFYRLCTVEDAKRVCGPTEEVFAEIIARIGRNTALYAQLDPNAPIKNGDDVSGSTYTALHLSAGVLKSARLTEQVLALPNVDVNRRDHLENTVLDTLTSNVIDQTDYDVHAQLIRLVAAHHSITADTGNRALANVLNKTTWLQYRRCPGYMSMLDSLMSSNERLAQFSIKSKTLNHFIASQADCVALSILQKLEMFDLEKTDEKGNNFLHHLFEDPHCRITDILPTLVTRPQFENTIQAKNNLGLCPLTFLLRDIDSTYISSGLGVFRLVSTLLSPSQLYSLFSGLLSPSQSKKDVEIRDFQHIVTQTKFDVNHQNASGETWCHQAAMAGSKAAVEAICRSNKFNPTVINSSGEIPLFTIFDNFDEEFCGRIFPACKWDLDATDRNGYTLSKHVTTYPTKKKKVPTATLR